MPEGGGNTRVSMGGFLCPSDSAKALIYFKALFEHSRSDMAPEIVQLFAEQSTRTVAFMTGLRENTTARIYGHAGFPDLPGADSMDKYIISGKGKGQTVFARNLWGLLSFAVEEKRKIESTK